MKTQVKSSTTHQPIFLKDLPSPKGHPILGHAVIFRDNPNVHQILEDWVQQYGDLFRIRLGPTPFLVSANPSINKQIMTRRPHDFRRLEKMNKVIREMGTLGVFNAEGDTWRKHRIPVARALNVRRIRNYFPVLKAKAEKLLEIFREMAEAGDPIEIQKYFMRFTVDVTTVIAFGNDLDTINTEENTFQRHLETVFPMIQERITAPFPYWRFVKGKKDRALDRSLEAVRQTIHKFIEDARRRMDENPELREKPANFLEALLVEQEAENFTDEEVYGNIFTLLLAGEDTTSNTLSWTVFYLAQHPEMVNKVREEAQAVFGPHPVVSSNEQLAELAYTHAVVQESLRIKPTTPLGYYESNTEVVLDGLRIPKGTRIILQNHVAQIDPENFTDPESFQPARWQKGGCPFHQEHTPEVMYAFGAGPRFCPGKYLATHEMIVMVSALCKRFDLELAVDPEQIVENLTFTMYPDNLWVKLRPCAN